MYLQADKKAIKKELLDIIENSRRKVTPGELEKALSRKYSLERKEIRSLIRGLVTENFLAYTSHYGRTFIEKSFNKAVRISKHVILKPPGVNYKYREDDVVIEICQGVSFGDGQHPTTRLAIKGIEYALNKTDLLKGKDKTSVLDIGTGSGVLGITALLLGIKNAVGLDIDPCSIKEAMDNAKINKLEDKFVIKNMSLEDLNTKFTLITANLRYPTLMNIYHRLVKMTEAGGAVVLSGIKSDEAISVVDLYTEKHFECKWKEFEKDWAGIVFSKPSK
ncbi:MAG: 50S ribosomal protein L11 methyltransferase [Proteobacteria bacterium]|nr:50S ribosomal protein L11 methyltransferase [Pseudomonadota bacterium]MBU4415030.1 50S ribosomal protein L11 methyltransferase [Pseudomonadota bacterium]MCG2758517.1 50S ribosomal protein L11 methyltransferase [Desulfobacteraceae bacterium]